MFSDKETNKKMLEGSYKKLKSYYHYNKNFIFMKQKIAEFEYDEMKMNKIFQDLSDVLSDLTDIKNKKIINQWINSIDFFVMPKSFTDKGENSKMFVSSDFQENKPINKVNFFIDMEIQLHLLETLWTILVGKIVYDKAIITENCYGNCIDNNIAYNRDEDFLSSINFGKNKLFKVYFYQYCAWKNNAINAIEKAHKGKKSTVLFSLDIKNYYYSVKFKFEDLSKIVDDDIRFTEIEKLTNIIEKIYLKYSQLLADYREKKHNDNEVLLPIGMFSSMLIANIYLSEFDKALKDNKNILYYGRYVDDMLILLDVSDDDAKKISKNTIIDDFLVNRNDVLFKVSENSYCLYKYENLTIQKDKVKIIYLEGKKSSSLINQLKKTIKIPSQMNVIPDTDLSLNDFEEAAYVIRNFNNETKIRDIGQIEVDRFQLGWHLSQMVQNSKVSKSLLTNDEKKNRQLEGEKIIDFFQMSRALEYSSNWINVMYYFLLIADLRTFKQFENNVRVAIKLLKTDHIDGIKKGKDRTIKAKMKKCLDKHLNICASTVLAINPKFSRKEKEEILILAIKLRRANLFNHYLVSYPLVNYVDDLNDNINLTKLTLEEIHKYNLDIKENRKVKLSPRFIKLDELFQWVFLRQVIQGGNWYLDGNRHSAKDKIAAIEQFFYKANNINISTVKQLKIQIDNTKVLDKYIIQHINLGEIEKPKSKIKIAIANIKLDTKMCFYGLEDQEMPTLKKKDLNMFLKTAYNEGGKPIDFLLFPEFYLPVEWISDILAFVRKTGVTIISGIQYMKYKKQAFNNVAVFAPFKTGRYQNAFLLVREKNDYAPMEQQLLAIKNYICSNQEVPNYQIISNNGIDYGTFLCYEFTDIIARSLYKNKVDILFTPEHNRDTTYFSNIIETTTRDLHVFIVQANTSIYGDSRVTGPYSRNDRNIVQIKGGDMDNVIIGTIDFEKVINYQIEEKEIAQKKIANFLTMDKSDRYLEEQKMYKENEIKIAKASARFDASRLKK